MIVALILLGSLAGCVGASFALLLEGSVVLALVTYSFTGSLGTLLLAAMYGSQNST